MSSYLNKYWPFVIAFLLVSTVAGGILLVIKQNSQQPVEISLASVTTHQYPGEIYIDGAVANPGFYPTNQDDTINNLVQTAGAMPNADLSHIKIYIPEVGESHQHQRIDINRAEAWLLEALPGIGQSKAQAIVDYRSQNGTFQRIEDLLKVEGIGNTTLERIRAFITVED